MATNNTIVKLNEYPPDKYNVLIPVSSMQVMSDMQRIIVNEVRLNPDPNGNDVYFDKQTRKYAITAVGGTKLAAAANISIVRNEGEQPEVCKRCIEMVRATGKAQSCGNCPHAYDVKHTVTIRVPEPSGGFRLITKSKEIDCSIEKASMTDGQYKRFLPHRASMAETKAYMRCLRAALGLAQGYTQQELARPFIIAHIVPNLDAPELRKALVNNTLRDMGLLFETPSEAPQIEQRQTAGLPESTADDSDDEPAEDAPYIDDDEQGVLPWDAEQESQYSVFPPEPEIVCADCGQPITGTTGANGKQWTPEAIRGFSKKKFGRCLCPDCQRRARQ